MSKISLVEELNYDSYSVGKHRSRLIQIRRMVDGVHESILGLEYHMKIVQQRLTARISSAFRRDNNFNTRSTLSCMLRVWNLSKIVAAVKSVEMGVNGNVVKDRNTRTRQSLFITFQ